MSKLMITIDGPAGSGKSTIARMLAKELEAVFLDTGSMYRAVTLAALKKTIDLHDTNSLLNIFNETFFDFQPCDHGMKVLINNNDVTDEIRTTQVTQNAKYIASNPRLRSELVKMQREFASKYEKVITEGRDQGTVVFPDADFKFYLNADIHERAKRRLNETGPDDKISLEQLKKQIHDRDESDRQREAAPLKKADDAIEIDTSIINQKQVLQKLLKIIRKS